MSNKAKNSKESILCDAKELMKLYDRVTWHLPKARREHSAVRRFEDAGYAIIHYCTIAMELKGESEQQRKRNPAAHCELRTASYLWKEHIAPEKSIRTKPEGIGAAIGRLIWQTAMGLYINNEILWLTEECGITLVCFVDDIVFVVPEDRHQYLLSLLPELRRRLAKKGVTLNEKKFYDQPYYHGCEFLGSHIRPNRIHLNNKTYDNAIRSIGQLNESRYKDIDAMVSVFNSYSGLLKNRTDCKRLLDLRDKLPSEWWQWLEWDGKRKCITYKQEYSPNERLNIKYHLKLKKHYDTIRNHRAEKCSLQRAQHAGVAA